jgi:hypothetical protein
MIRQKQHACLYTGRSTPFQHLLTKPAAVTAGAHTTVGVSTRHGSIHSQ